MFFLHSKKVKIKIEKEQNKESEEIVHCILDIFLSLPFTNWKTFFSSLVWMFCNEKISRNFKCGGRKFFVKNLFKKLFERISQNNFFPLIKLFLSTMLNKCSNSLSYTLLHLFFLFHGGRFKNYRVKEFWILRLISFGVTNFNVF